MIDHKKKTINAHWFTAPSPGNFGDILTPYLIKKICGYSAIRVKQPFTRTTLLAVGSIIKLATHNTVVWGTGTARTSDKLHADAKYLAVRGPITRDLIVDNGGKCPAIFGDPGLLLPKYYNKQQTPKYDIGFLPHYVDYKEVNSWYGKDSSVKVIDIVDANIENVVNQMRQCRSIVTSSLHGNIVASAYGIPVTWVKFSNKLVGDGTKFRDFFSSVDVSHQPTEIFEKPKTVDDFKKLDYIKTINFEPNLLLSAFPVQP